MFYYGIGSGLIIIRCCFSFKSKIMSTATNCSLSGSPTIDPVISLKTGHIYEKSTIQKHISVYATCPHTNQPLSHSDLLGLANN